MMGYSPQGFAHTTTAHVHIPCYSPAVPLQTGLEVHIVAARYNAHSIQQRYRDCAALHVQLEAL